MTPPTQMRPPRQKGFTLVEVMLAVLLLAIMMSIVYAIVLSTVQAAQRVEEINQSSEIGPAILAQIRQDLEGAYLPPKDGEFFVSLSRKGSTGDRDRIDFVTTRMAYGARMDGGDPAFHSVNEAGYQLVDSKADPNVATLYRREDFFIDNEPLRGGHLIEMYDRVTHFHLEFYDGDKWVQDWNSKLQKNRLPRAVKVELRLLVSDREDKNVLQTFTTTVTYDQ